MKNHSNFIPHGDRLKAFPLRSETNMDAYSHHFYLILYCKSENWEIKSKSYLSQKEIENDLYLQMT